MDIKQYNDNDLLRELQRRGWHKTEKPIAIGCCGKGRRVILTRNPWDPYKPSEQELIALSDKAKEIGAATAKGMARAGESLDEFSQ